MNQKQAKLVYCSYYRHEIELLESIFEKVGAVYVIAKKKTNRNITYFTIESMVTKEEEISICKEVKRFTAHISNWGRKGYQKTKNIGISLIPIFFTCAYTIDRRIL